MFLKISQNSQGISFSVNLQAQTNNFIKNEIATYLFSCEFCEVPKNTFFYSTFSVATSVIKAYLNKRTLNDTTKNKAIIELILSLEILNGITTKLDESIAI